MAENDKSNGTKSSQDFVSTDKVRMYTRINFRRDLKSFNLSNEMIHYTHNVECRSVDLQ